MSADIKIRGLNFSYEKQEVLRGINLDYSVSDFLVIIGPNGGGKSTLLKLIKTSFKALPAPQISRES